MVQQHPARRHRISGGETVGSHEEIQRIHPVARHLDAIHEMMLPHCAKDQAQGGPLHRQVDALSRRKAWTQLPAKVHALDLMACLRCGSCMSVIAVIVEPT